MIFRNTSSHFFLFLFLFLVLDVSFSSFLFLYFVIKTISCISLTKISFPLQWLKLTTGVESFNHWSGKVIFSRKHKKIFLTIINECQEDISITYYNIALYSSGANIGSQEGSMIGFCSSIFMISAGTYFFSTTTRNMYSLNHSSVIIKLP